MGFRSDVLDRHPEGPPCIVTGNQERSNSANHDDDMMCTLYNFWVLAENISILRNFGKITHFLNFVSLVILRNFHSSFL